MRLNHGRVGERVAHLVGHVASLSREAVICAVTTLSAEQCTRAPQQLCRLTASFFAVDSTWECLADGRLPQVGMGMV